MHRPIDTKDDVANPTIGNHQMVAWVGLVLVVVVTWLVIWLLLYQLYHPVSLWSIKIPEGQQNLSLAVIGVLMGILGFRTWPGKIAIAGGELLAIFLFGFRAGRL